MKAQDKKQILDLLLTSPNTCEDCFICSPLYSNDDGSISFEIFDPSINLKLKHTIKTEEV
jgi:hypothetical protein